MDIHKKVVVATVQGDGISKETNSFGTFTSSLTQLREWLVSLGITHVAMESTGVYWKPIYNVFEDYIRNIWIVNALHIKNVPGHKTDKNDSEWICQLLMAGLLKPSFIPPREQRELGDSYVPEKKEKQRKEYLKGELKKLGYNVVLTKKKD